MSQAEAKPVRIRRVRGAAQKKYERHVADRPAARGREDEGHRPSDESFGGASTSAAD